MIECLFILGYLVGVWLSSWFVLTVVLIGMRIELPDGMLIRYALWSTLSWVGGYMIYKDLESRS